MKNHDLFFDEYDIKEHATTETLKRGKKAFQKNTIHDVSLHHGSLHGTYIRGKVIRKVKITKKDAKLIGTIDNAEIKPFTAPLTALAYWYINYMNENKHFAQSDSTNNNTLEPFHKIQLTFIYDEKHNKINLTLYQPETAVFCDESHLFIHSFHQLIQHFDSNSQSLIQKLNQHYDETFFYQNYWVKNEPYISKALVQLVNNKILYNEKHHAIKLIEAPIHLKITCKITSHQLLISFVWITEDKQTSISVHDAMQCEKTNHIIFQNECYQIQNPMHSKIALQFKNHSFQRLDISKIKPFINKLVELRKKVGLELAIDANIQQLKKVTIDPTCIIDVKPNKNGGTLTIRYKYNDLVVLTSNPTPYIIFDDFTYTQRNLELEHQYRDVLLHYHPSSTEEDTITYPSPYFDQVLGDIKEKGIENIALSKESQKSITKSKEKISATIQFKTSSQSQMKASIQWSHPNTEKMTQKLHNHIQIGIHHYFDPKENKIIPIEHSPLLDTLSKQEDLAIPAGVAIFLALNTDVDIVLPDQLQSAIKTLKNQKKITINKSDEKILRPFQKEGLRWLLSLYNTHLNGILADDMGLGKTIQSIMLLKNIYKTETKPTLIIMPKTLLFNWEKELETFAPELKVLLYDGPKRLTLVDEFPKFQIILCSYTSIRLDTKKLKDTTFNLIILDEAQYVKNHTTNTFKAIKKINATKKLLLTGTPLENSISDLWSLMDIANHNYFGNFKLFEEFYSDPNHQPLLKAAITPLMLRRRKQEVLKDLPSVTIQELWASPSPEEIKAYTTFANQEWQQIESMVQEKGLEKSKIHIFALMTKLRQWCAHPKLISKDSEDGPKWLIFYDRLQEALSTGHKVVVFSQFIPMIETMEQKLTENDIQFVSLTGQTKNRAEVIETFNENEDIRVGLFSLKAGGVGINLTSADYVFLYDPWWNPAVEQQAIDRVHRIGQDQPVMVFKCLVASTIEERMIVYQNQKRELIQSLIDEQSIKNLNLNEIKALIGI